MADAATMTMKAVLLPDEIQATLKDLTFAYTPADASEKWFFGLVNVTTSSNDLISGDFLVNSAGTDTSDGGVGTADISVSDKVKFLFIKNTASRTGSDSTTDGVMLLTDGGVVAHGVTNGIWIGTGESWYAKLPNTTVGDLHVRTTLADISNVGGGDVQCIVAAIIDDVA